MVSIVEALKKAEEANLDLVKISAKAVPPVCRIIDYSKYKFEKTKKEKEARKNRKGTDVKEIRLSVNIDIGDFNTKVNHARKFMLAGSKVKVTLRFKGREFGHTELGKKVFSNFSKACEDFATTEKLPKLEGKSLVMFLAPKPNISKNN